MVRHQVLPGRGHLGAQLLDEGEQFEDHRLGPVRVSPAQAVVDPAVREEPQTLLRDGPTRHVAAKALQPFAVRAVNPHVGMQGESPHLGAPSACDEVHVRRIRQPPLPVHVRARFRTESHTPLDRGGVARLQQRRLEGKRIALLLRMLYVRAFKSQAGQHLALDLGGKGDDLLVRGCRQGG